MSIKNNNLEINIIIYFVYQIGIYQGHQLISIKEITLFINTIYNYNYDNIIITLLCY